MKNDGIKAVHIILSFPPSHVPQISKKRVALTNELESTANEWGSALVEMDNTLLKGYVSLEGSNNIINQAIAKTRRTQAKKLEAKKELIEKTEEKEEETQKSELESNNQENQPKPEDMEEKKHESQSPSPSPQKEIISKAKRATSEELYDNSKRAAEWSDLQTERADSEIKKCYRQLYSLHDLFDVTYPPLSLRPL